MDQQEKWNIRYRERGDSGLLEPSGILVEELEGVAPGSVLELAAGDGRNALYLARKGWDVTAVDFSPVAVERGRRFARKAGVEIRWETADLTVYEPRDAAYDWVIIFYLHLGGRRFPPILRRAARAVTPGGTLLVVGHHLKNLEEGGHGPRDPRALYTREAIIAELEGFHVVRSDVVRHAHDHAGAEDTQVDCVVAARRTGGGISGP